MLKSAKKDDANLAREIHHHRQFLHPHIARLYEVIVTESMVWLVLEYCPGDELYNHLSRHGRMEASKAQKIFTQLVGAVSYVHAKQCVHRDLKLENILLDKNGSVKLVDFGFTREYQGTTSYLQTWCGTVCYSAPEMLKGEKYAGEKVDVWSLGIILYALLCGELPFDEDDDTLTKAAILKEEPKYHDYIPEPGKELLQKLLSKRPLLRPSLSDVLKDPWLAEFAPQQQEILKIQQPAPFTTELEKETLQRMRSAGVDIDLVIENVLSQRCDALAGWWALLMDKETRKQRRRDRKRKEREAEAKSLRRLSAASGRLLGALSEGEEIALGDSPGSRGRRLTRTHGSLKVKAMPQVEERKSPTPEPRTPGIDQDQINPLELVPTSTTARLDSASRSRSRPAPPPKDLGLTLPKRPRAISRNSSSMLRNVTNNPDLLGPAYVPPVRKRRIFYQQPLREQIAALKHWIKEGARRNKSPHSEGKGKARSTLDLIGTSLEGASSRRDLSRVATDPTQHRKASIGNRPELTFRATMPARPRVETDTKPTAAKRQSLSPHNLTPHSSYRRSSVGLRGRKSTSSSVSSIRSTYQPGHIHTLSKASSTSSNSVASPGGVSASSARLGRSPHSSVKVLPGTGLPNGLRLKKNVPAHLGTLPDNPSPFNGPMPASPGIPIFARRKRSVFKGPVGHTSSPSGFGRVSLPPRSGSMSGRRSGEMMPGVTEEDEGDEEAFDDEDDDGKWEEVDHFGPELPSNSPGFAPRHVDDSPVTPLDEIDATTGAALDPDLPGVPSEGDELTEAALARKDAEDQARHTDLQSIKSVEVTG